MFTSSLITFRETIEAILVISIVFAILSKQSANWKLKKFVWFGTFVGVLLSVITAYFLQFFFGGFSGKTEQVFEGTLMFVTTLFLTWMIIWVHKQKNLSEKIKQKLAPHIEKGYGLGIASMVAISVLREGVETVLYLRAVGMTGSTNQLIGAVLGLILALILGCLLFARAVKINLSAFFTASSIFLLLFAAGLISHGVHEFQEVGLLPVFFFDPVLNISFILSNDSIFGSFLRTIFGYTAKPTLLEIFFYSFYILIALRLQKTVISK
ncbi:MAG: FTR1 family protein [Candidatus Levybacteria bacterium]|nr:FTR1 family protein [Candidatus Levybacteria bacterium]